MSPIEFNRDELRREVRAIERAHRESDGAHQSLIEAAFESGSPDAPAAVVLGMDRRGFFRVGGLAVAATAVLAACREHGAKHQIPVSGTAPSTTALASKPVTDTVLLRTASSLEWSIINGYEQLLQNNFVDDPDIAALLRVFEAHHRVHAQTFADLTTAAGGTACIQLNSKITGDLLDPLVNRIGAAGDNQHNDAVAFAHTLETLAGASYQSFVPTFSQPALRKAAMSVGAVEGRHAAVLASILNKDTYLGSGAAATAPVETEATTTTIKSELQTTAPKQTTTTTLPPIDDNQYFAVPSTFGSLAQIPITVGPSVEGVSRKPANLDTPSLNSFLYDDEKC